jgi:hypothetical protein
MEITAYISIIIAFAITIPLSMFECMRQSDKKMVSFNKLVKTELDSYFLKENTTKYEKRGLEWFVIDGHYWIELRIYAENKENAMKTDLPNSNF